MHLAGPNVITVAGRSLSLIINTDLDIFLKHISPAASLPPDFFIFIVCLPLPYLCLESPWCDINTVHYRRCFNVQLPIMRQGP